MSVATAVFLLVSPFLVRAQLVSAPALASAYGLTSSTSLSFPSATMAAPDASNAIIESWGVNRGHLQNGVDNFAFVADPFPSSSSGNSSSAPVLAVTYPQSQFGSDSSGAQFYSLWNSSQNIQTILLSYEIAFAQGYDFVKGGKLPGVRGGPDPIGCSGGNQSNGVNCFSARLMWRKKGQGEVYTYIPTPNDICDSKNVQCNDEFGASLSRGSFSFVTGMWSKISLLVRLNEPPNIANGYMELYFNDVKALSQDSLQIRAADSVNMGGLYFSTFFGGNDASWAPSSAQQTYFRNFNMWGSTAPSNLTGVQVKNHALANTPPSGLLWSFCCVVTLFYVGFPSL